MKCKVSENPSIKEAYRLIEDGIRKRALVVILACCSASYEVVQGAGLMPVKG